MEDISDDWEEDQLVHNFNSIQVNKPTTEQDGGSYSSPASAATVCAVGQGPPMDPVLVDCLENTNERMMLLKFEDRIVRFLKNERLAERCGLAHQSSEIIEASDNTTMRSISLVKTSKAALPSILLIDLSAERKQQRSSTRKIMVRQRETQRKVPDGKQGCDTSFSGDHKLDFQSDRRYVKSMQDRERAYAEARARIFGADESSASTNPGTTTSTNSYATGPDGTRGFTSGRRKESRRSVKEQTNTMQERVNCGTSVKKEKRWNESKATLRNREEELNDPDFTRNYDMYRPSIPPFRGVDTSIPPAPHSNPYHLQSSYGLYPGIVSSPYYRDSCYAGNPSSSRYSPSIGTEYRNSRDGSGNGPLMFSQMQQANAGMYQPHSNSNSMDNRTYYSDKKKPDSRHRQPPNRSSYNEDFPPLG